MYEKVKKYIDENHLIGTGDVVIAGVSGGADSVAMLDMLQRFCTERQAQLAVVHVNHGIRGPEAMRDQQYVEALCEAYGISCEVFAYDVPELAKQLQMGEEETGRKVRRQAFAQAKLRYDGASVKIAIAHNENDQAETMLHHLARGSGLRGLGAIRPLTCEADCVYIRPILCLQRDEIVAYLDRKQITYMTDSTNEDDDYTRNRIRHQILPILSQQVNEQAVAHLAQTAGIMQDADEYFTVKAKNTAEECRKNEEFLIKDSYARSSHRIELYYLILEILELTAGCRKDFSYKHVQMVEELFEMQTGKMCILPYGIQAVKDYTGVLIRKQSGIIWENQEWELAIPGRLECEAGIFECRLLKYYGQKILQKKYTKWFDYDKIKGNFSVRYRKAGDFIHIEPNCSRKKITRIMIDDKIPSDERATIPLIVCDTEVLWMVGGRMNERYKITEDSKSVLEITYTGVREK